MKFHLTEGGGKVPQGRHVQPQLTPQFLLHVQVKPAVNIVIKAVMPDMRERPAVGLLEQQHQPPVTAGNEGEVGRHGVSIGKALGSPSR